jgi:hypothetical protein
MFAANKPTVPDALPVVLAFLNSPGNSTGGNLHIVLEDGNLSDKDIQFCIDAAREQNDVAAQGLGRMLLRMSKTQRKKIYLRCHAL